MTASTQPERYDEIFVVEPPNVEFNAYEIGETYELKLTIRNKSALSRRLRVLPPASRHFSVTEMRWPSQHGMLAPGMSCSCSVRFKPDSLADYEDSLTVLSEVMKFELDLAARRHPPKLTLDAVIDVGHVLVGNDVEFRLPFKNVGGQGRFRAVDDEDWPERATPLALPNLDAALEPGESPEDDPTPCVRLAPFRVGPGVMDLAPMQWEKLRVGFAPPGPGEFTREFRLVCDNCQVRTFAVRGRGAVLGARRDPHRLARRRARRIRQPRGVVRGRRRARSRQDATFHGTKRHAGSVTVRMGTSVRGGCVCRRARGGDVGAERRDGIRRDVRAARGGVVRTTIQTPRGLRVPTSRTTQRRGDVRTTRRGGIRAGGWRRARARRRRRREPRQFRRRAPPGRHYDREIRLTNRGDAACAFAWRGQDDFSRARRDRRGGRSRCWCTRRPGRSRPGSRRACVVELVADDASRCDRTLVCVCEHGPELFVRVTAEVEGPEVVFAQSSLDFGLLQRGVPGDAYLVLRNASPVPAAWTLEEKDTPRTRRRGARLSSPRRGGVATTRGGGGGVHADAVRGGGVPRRGVVRRGRRDASPSSTLEPTCFARDARCRDACEPRRVSRRSAGGTRGGGAEHDDAPRGVSLGAGAGGGIGRGDGRARFRVRLARGRVTPGRIASGSVQIHALQTVPIVRRHRRVRRGRRRETTRVRGRVRDSRLTRRVRHLQGRRSGRAVRVRRRVRPEQTASIGDAVRLDFGDDCEVREHAAMELVIRNVTAMEVPVWISAERLGVPDDVAARVMEARADAKSADGAGLAGGGVSGAGARAVGGLPGGDGIVAAALRSTSVMQPEAFGAEVFGAASTAGPALSASRCETRETDGGAEAEIPSPGGGPRGRRDVIRRVRRFV